MQIRRMSLFFLISRLLLWSVCAHSLSTSNPWAPLTSVKKTSCDFEKKLACAVGNSGLEFQVQMKPEKFDDNGVVRLRLDSMKIKEASQAPSEAELYYLNQTNFLSLDEFYELYKVNLRPSGETDLAVFAYSSASEGPMYYYFLYDQKKKNFVLTEFPVPKLHYDKKTDRYLSEIQERPFQIKRNHIEEVDESLDEANKVQVYPAQQ